MKSYKIALVCLAALAAAFAPAIYAQTSFITGVSFSAPSYDGVGGSVTAPPYPLNTSQGTPGYIINSASFTPNIFAMTAHAYASANIPASNGQNVVTFTFDAPTVVDQLKVIEHANGVTKIQGFVGDSLGSLVSMGDIFGSAGDRTGGSAFSDGATSVFDFNNTNAGLIYQFVFTKTSLDTGWAVYRAYPADATGTQFGPAVSAIPEPSTYAALFGLAALGIAAYRRRHRQAA
jgi:hypothetical protein